MTGTSQISIVASVSESEQAAIQLAAGHMARAVSQATEVTWECDCVFCPEIEKLPPLGDEAIIVTSLRPETEKLDELWLETEQRLRTAYATLSERNVPVFICTVLRHVSRDEDPEFADALRVRIRQLNLLAAVISHETGAYVIDLDRALADIGARRLQADYRLASKTAAEVAGHFIALTLINNGLDAYVPFEIQDAAKEITASYRPSVAGPDHAAELSLTNNNLLMGKGRRKQIVAPVLKSDQKSQADWLVRQVMQGKLGPAMALGKLVQAIRRNGFREIAGLIVSGMAGSIRSRK
jgi:hypothetical protein